MLYSLTDDSKLMDNHPEIYKKRWQLRCSKCPAPCCFFSMSGFNFDNRADNGNGQNFFTHDFIVIKFNRQTNEEKKAAGFNIQLDTPEFIHNRKGLQVCPLSIHGRCLIYEDRPFICKFFKCDLALKRPLINGQKTINKSEIKCFPAPL